MIKINEYKYTKEKLQEIMNKKWENLVAIDNWLIITKVTITTSRQLVAKKEADKFFEQFEDIKKPVIDNELMTKISTELNIEWSNERELLAKFLNFRLEWKSEWKPKWERERKKRWTFEIANRMRTFMWNNKDKPKEKKAKTITI